MISAMEALKSATDPHKAHEELRVTDPAKIDDQFGKCVTNLLAGDTFGEESLSNGDQRNATIITCQPTELIVVDRELFQKISNLHIVYAPNACMDILKSSPEKRTKPQIQRLQKFSKQIRFFSQIPDCMRERICGEMRYELIPAGEAVVHEGGYGNCLFVILSGSVSVHKKSIDVKINNIEDYTRDLEFNINTILEESIIDEDISEYGECMALLSAGDSFGAVQAEQEHCKTKGQRRNASVVTREDSEFIVLPHAVFENSKEKINFQPSLCRNILMRRHRTEAEINSLKSLLVTLDFFTQFSDPILRRLSQSLTLQNAEVGETIVTQGDVGEAMFIILSGKVNVYVASSEEALQVVLSTDGRISGRRLSHMEMDEAGYGNYVGSLNQGDSFGEKSLQKEKEIGRRLATIVAATHTELIRLDQSDYQSILRKTNKKIQFQPSKEKERAKMLMKAASKVHTANYIKNRAALTEVKRQLRLMLDESPIFDRLDSKTKLTLEDAFAAETYASSNTIFLQGDHASKFYIIVYGEVSLYDGSNTIVKTLVKGQCFGDLSLIWRTSQLIEARAESDVICVTLSRSEYDSLWREKLDQGQAESALFFRALSIFKNCPLTSLGCIFLSTHITLHSRGAIIGANEYSPDYLLFILRGECQVVLSSHMTTSKTNQKKANSTISLLGIGQCIDLRDISQGECCVTFRCTTATVRLHFLVSSIGFLKRHISYFFLTFSLFCT